MNFKKTGFSALGALLACVLSFTPCTWAQDVPDAVRNAHRVASLSEDAVRDGDNDIAQLNRRDIRKKISVIYSSGGTTGVIARGEASYRIYPNRDASEISLHNAYARAYMKAQAEMIRFFDGVSALKDSSMGDSLETEMTGDKTLKNKEFLLSQNLKNAASGNLRNFTVLDIYDDTAHRTSKAGTVTVSIISTERLAKNIQGITPGLSQAVNIGAATAEVEKKLKQGVLPPAGAQIIRISGTDGKSGIAVLSYGSEYVGDNDPDLLAFASAAAGAASTAAMIETLQNVRVTARTGVTTSTAEKHNEFRKVTKKDVFGNSVTTKEPLREAVDTFQNSNSIRNDVSTTVNGKLPAGVMEREVISYDSNGTPRWVYSVHIYNRSISRQAEELKDRLDAIHAPEIESGDSLTPGDIPAPGTGSDTFEIEKGPSGHVQDLSLL